MLLNETMQKALRQHLHFNNMDGILKGKVNKQCFHCFHKYLAINTEPLISNVGACGHLTSVRMRSNPRDNLCPKLGKVESESSKVESELGKVESWPIHFQWTLFQADGLIR